MTVTKKKYHVKHTDTQGFSWVKSCPVETFYPNNLIDFEGVYSDTRLNGYISLRVKLNPYLSVTASYTGSVRKDTNVSNSLPGMFDG